MLISKKTGRIIEIVKEFEKTEHHFVVGKNHYMKNHLEVVEGVEIPEYIEIKKYFYKNGKFEKEKEGTNE